MLIAVKLASQKRVQHLKDKAKDYAEKQARRICEKKSHLDVTDMLPDRQHKIASKMYPYYFDCLYFCENFALSLVTVWYSSKK